VGAERGERGRVWHATECIKLPPGCSTPPHPATPLFSVCHNARVSGSICSSGEIKYEKFMRRCLFASQLMQGNKMAPPTIPATKTKESATKKS